MKIWKYVWASKSTISKNIKIEFNKKLIIKIKCLSVFLRISSEIPERRSKTFFLSQFNTCIIHIIKERKYILITE